MSLAGVYELLLQGLAGDAPPRSLGYMSPEAAYEELKRRTGQDFGYDVENWREYIRGHREELRVGPFERI
jgi:hypothetical protein